MGSRNREDVEMDKICSKCGTSNEESAKFCVGCSAEFPSIEANMDSSEPVVEQTGEYVEQVAEEPVAEEQVAEEQVAEESVVSEPMGSEPMGSEPVVSEPVVSEPMGSEPVFAPATQPAVPAPQPIPPAPQPSQVYTAPTPQAATQPAVPQESEKPVHVIAWIGLFLLRIIPLGAIIVIIIAMTSKNQSLRNYGKAKLILMIISIVLVIAFIIVNFDLVQEAVYTLQDIINEFI